MKGSEKDGIEIATILRQDFQLPVIYITAHTDDATLKRARNSEPYGYLVKPFDERDLRVAIETGLYKHRIEREMARREAQLSAILKSTSDAVIATDTTAEVTFMNPAAENLTGWLLTEALGRSVTEVLPLIDEISGEAIAHPIPQVLQSGQVAYLDDYTATIDRQGVKKPVGDSTSPINMPSGVIDGAVMVLCDRSERAQLDAERKRTEAALLESEARFRNAFETAAIGMALNALDGKFIKVNAALCQTLGYSTSELLSLKFQDITYADDLQADLDATQSLLRGEVSSFNLEKRFWHKNKTIIWTILSVSLVRDANQQPVHLIAQMQNISDRKQAEIALSQLNQELESRVVHRTEALQQSELRLIAANEQLAIMNDQLARVTRLKDEFLASMSHELRTPLNAILGMTEALQEGVFGKMNERQIRALKIVENSGSHLLELINDILDVAKIESGQIELAIAPTNIVALCQSSLAFIRQQALKKNIQIESQIPSNLPDLLVDERRIRQVLINLLNNAVKFTPDGGRITLQTSYLPQEMTVDSPLQGITRVRIYRTVVEQALGLSPQIFPESQERETETRGFLRIAVIDTGIGIAPEHIDKLFQPFIQIDSSLNRQYAGTGLGLTIVKRIVELHGGQVGVISEVGVGSCFMIDLPYTASVSSSSESEAHPEPSIGLKPEPSPLILLAEDNQANVSTVWNYLEAKGYRMLLAKNGREAVALAQTECPDLILMDIQMPEMDGLEAIRLIRSTQHIATVPIIALTALAMPSDQERCIEAGANRYFSKPMMLKQLVEAIQQLLEA